MNRLNYFISLEKLWLIIFESMKQDEDPKVCRICFEEESKDKPVINPCKCRGSSKYIHEECLSTWILTQDLPNNEKKCEVCKFVYNIKIKSIQKCDPRESLSRNPHFVCYLCILVIVTSLLVILIYVSIDKGFVNPEENIYYFLGLIIIFGLALMCSFCIMVKLIKGIFYVECSKSLKILPIKDESFDLNTTTVVNSLHRIDSSQENIGEHDEARRINLNP